MTNDSNETIIDSTTTNDTQDETTTVENAETSTEDTTSEETTKENTSTNDHKQTETPEAKRARLKRQLDQHEKKFGFQTETKNTVTVKETIQPISTKDLYALTKANVPEEDIAEVEEFAKFKKVSISEALKSTALKSILAEKEENRTVANASNVGNTKRASSKVSDESLAQKASKGELPDSESDLTRLIKNRKGLK